MATIKRLVLDLLKPHRPSIVEFADGVAESSGVAGVNAVLLETDREVQNVKLTLEGDDLDVESVEARVEELGGTVHSVDEVSVGEYRVDESKTPQG